MNNDKMIQFVKRWLDIERRQKDLDFERSKLSRDIRCEFPSGERGDEQFSNWCVNELGLTSWAAKELLTRAVAATVVPDERTWKMIGGFRAIRPLQDLTKTQQVTVLEAAKTSGRAPINIMRERGLIQAPTPREPARIPARTSSPVNVTIVRKPPQNDSAPVRDAYADAVALAQYIARTGKDLPRDIIAIVARYASAVKAA